jgi:hypothetical protein
VNQKTERWIEFSQHQSWWVQTIIGHLCIHPAFPYRIKRKVLAGSSHFERSNGTTPNEAEFSLYMPFHSSAIALQNSLT